MIIAALLLIAGVLFLAAWNIEMLEGRVAKLERELKGGSEAMIPLILIAVSILAAMFVSAVFLTMTVMGARTDQRILVGRPEDQIISFAAEGAD